MPDVDMRLAADISEDERRDDGDGLLLLLLLLLLLWPPLMLWRGPRASFTWERARLAWSSGSSSNIWDWVSINADDDSPENPNPAADPGDGVPSSAVT